MRTSRASSLGRVAVATILVLAAACSDATKSPTGLDSDDDPLVSMGIDPTATATPGQASLPGLTLDLHAYFPRIGARAFGDEWNCSFSQDVERFVCDPVQRRGLTFTRTYAFYDADGNSQPRHDENTRSMNTQVGVTGTLALDDGSLSVDRASELTVTGLGRESAERTLNGTERETTVATRTRDGGTVTVTEVGGDTVTDVVVRAPRDRDDWPLSGTAVHSAKVTVEATGKEARTFTRRAVVTFNGTRFVPVVITRNDVTRSCIRDLLTHRTRCE